MYTKIPQNDHFKLNLWQKILFVVLLFVTLVLPDKQHFLSSFNPFVWTLFMCGYFFCWTFPPLQFEYFIHLVLSYIEKCPDKYGEISEIEIVFCYQNCSDLLWEKNVQVIEKNFWNSRLKAENLQNLWDH